MRFWRGVSVKWFRRLLIAGMGMLASAVAMILWAERVAKEAGQGVLFEEAAEVPETPVALVFGCNRLINGRPNLYFKYRIEAAAALWKEGKVQCLIVSGDNHREGYNEPEDMKAALVEAGVAAEKIV